MIKWWTVISYKKFALVIVFILLLVSCGEKNVHKQIMNHLEKAYVSEEEFIEYQEELLRLEEKDLELYDEVVQLEGSEANELQSLIGEALKVTEQREAYLEAERTAIKQSKENFLHVEPYIEQVTDEDVKSNLEKLYKTMTDRYEVYEEVYESYATSLQLTESLYEHLRDNSSQYLLHDTLDDVNESYEQLFTVNDRFNRLTKDYNRLKKEY